MDRTIIFEAPNIGAEERESLLKVFDSGYISTAGHWVSDFENNFADYLKAPKAVATQNGTAALHIALHELGIKEGDEVIVPVSTFIASVNPVRYANATPVFVDIDPETWNMDHTLIEKNITPKTKAILVVHLYGNPAHMEAIMAIAKKHNLYVIEDATESLGATYAGRFTGLWGDFGCFSFNGNKIITTGSGGMVVGSDIKRLDHIKFLVNQAKDSANTYYHSEIGFNYRMTSIEASLGLSQLKKLDSFLLKKRKLYQIYREELQGLESVTFQKSLPQSHSSCWLNGLMLKSDIDIQNLQKKMAEHHIPTRRNFMPIVDFPPYVQFKRGDYPNAKQLYERGLCLPNSTLNSEDDIRYICQQFKRLIKK